MSIPVPSAPRSPILISGDGSFHDGFILTTAYRGRLVGVESEFFIIDRETLEIRDCMAVLERHSQFGSRVKAEIIREQIEICSNAFSSIAELEAQLREDLRETVDLLEEVGAMLLPVSLFEKGTYTWSADPRIALLQERLGGRFRSLAGTITADQINIGANDEEDAFRIFGRILEILPEIVGLGAASPFREGMSNGVACNRMVVYDEAVSAVPGLSGLPPFLRTLEEYAEFISNQPCFKHPGTCYAYVRPMPHRGVSAEIRCIDKQPTLSRTLAFAALAKAVMHSTGDLPFPADCSLEAMAASRERGVVDRERCAVLLEHLAQFLPNDEVRYLSPLSADVEGTCTSEKLVIDDRKLGHDGLLRFLAESLLDDIRRG